MVCARKGRIVASSTEYPWLRIAYGKLEGNGLAAIINGDVIRLEKDPTHDVFGRNRRTERKDDQGGGFLFFLG